MPTDSPSRHPKIKVTHFASFKGVAEVDGAAVVTWVDHDDAEHSVPLDDFAQETSAQSRLLAMALLADSAVPGAERALIAQHDPDICVMSYEKALATLPRATLEATAQTFGIQPEDLDSGGQMTACDKIVLAASVVLEAAGVGQRLLGELSCQSLAMLSRGSGWNTAYLVYADMIFPTRASSADSFLPRDRVSNAALARRTEIRKIMDELRAEHGEASGDKPPQDDLRAIVRQEMQQADASPSSAGGLSVAAVKEIVKAMRARDVDDDEDDEEGGSKKPAYAQVSKASHRLGILEISGFTGGEPRKILKDLDDSFRSHNGDELFDIIQWMCKADRMASQLFLIADAPSIDEIMDGKDWNRKTLRRSRVDVRLKRRHDMAVLLQVRQQGPPSARPRGRAREIDVSQYATTGVPPAMCVSSVWPYCPSRPLLSLWGPGTADSPGAPVQLTSHDTAGPTETHAAIAEAILHDGIWVPSETTCRWERNMQPRRHRQQFTVTHAVPCTAEVSDDVPRHKLVHTFRGRTRAATGLKCPYGPALDRVVPNQSQASVQRHLTIKDPTWHTYNDAATLLGVEWRCGMTVAGPPTASKPGEADRCGQRTVVWVSHATASSTPRSVRSGELRCGATRFVLTAGATLFQHTGILAYPLPDKVPAPLQWTMTCEEFLRTMLYITVRQLW